MTWNIVVDAILLVTKMSHLEKKLCFSQSPPLCVDVDVCIWERVKLLGHS